MAVLWLWLFLLLMDVLAEVEVEVEVEGVRRRRPRPRLPPPPPPPVRRWNLETRVETRRRMDIDMEDWCELDETVEGECFRLCGVDDGGRGAGLSLMASSVWAARGKERMKEGGTGIFFFESPFRCTHARTHALHW